MGWENPKNPTSATPAPAEVAARSAPHQVGQSVIVCWRYVDSSPVSWLGRFVTGHPRNKLDIVYSGELRSAEVSPNAAASAPPIFVPFFTARGVPHDKKCSWPPPPNVVVISVTVQSQAPHLSPAGPPPPQEPKQRAHIEKEQLEALSSLHRSIRRLASRLKVPTKPKTTRQAAAADQGPTPLATAPLSEDQVLAERAARNQRDIRLPPVQPIIGPVGTTRAQERIVLARRLGVSAQPPLPQTPSAPHEVPADHFDIPENHDPALEHDRRDSRDNDSDQDEDDPADLHDTVTQLSQQQPLPDFRCGGVETPHVAALSGSYLIELLKRPPPVIPNIALMSFVKTTHQEHRRMLKLLLTMPEPLQRRPLAEAVLEFIMRRRRSRGWRWSTTIKYLACAQGALSSLPLYRACRTPILLSKDTVWTHGIRATARKARAELPQQPTAATWKEVEKCLRTERSLPTFVAVLLAWFTAARVGCILQLTKADVTMHNDFTMSVRFTRGKSALLRASAYTVHTAPIPHEFQDRLQRWMAERHTWLFPRETTGTQVKLALRRVNSTLEQRSLRRGSLQALSRAPGMTDENLLLFSGHSNVRTLRRYLNWGVVADHTRRSMVAAAGASLIHAG